MKQDWFSIHQIADKFMLWIGNVVVNNCGRAESSSLPKQRFEGLDFLTIKFKNWSGTWWNWFRHIHYLTTVFRRTTSDSLCSKASALSTLLQTHRGRYVVEPDCRPQLVQEPQACRANESGSRSASQAPLWRLRRDGTTEMEITQTKVQSSGRCCLGLWQS